MATQSTTVSAITDTGTKGGYGYDFVSPPPKSLECPICLLTMRDPHVISCCGNEFCQVCIDRVKRDGKPCPLCNEQNFSTMLHKKLIREVNALVVHCPQKEMGCEWEGELCQVQNHLYPKVDEPELELRSTAVTPKGCCYVPVACTYKCGVELQRGLLAKHERDACPKRPIQMQIASLTHTLENILVSNQLLRKELDEIKQSHQSEIRQLQLQHQQELVDIKKKYCEILEHSKSQQQVVMKAIDVVTHNVQQEEGLKEKITAELKNDVEKLVEQKSRSLKDEVQKDMEKLVKQKSRSPNAEDVEKFVDQKSQSLKAEVRNDMEKVIEQKNRLLKTEVRKDVEKFVNQKNRSLSVHTMPLPVPPFYFTLNNIEHYKESNFCWYSDPFYSHPGGYKMVVAIYPNGRSTGLGTHLSLYVNVIRGEFDNQLEWPCNFQVIIEAWEQQTCQWTNQECIAVDPTCTLKPTNFRRNKGLGLPEYIHHYDLPDYYTTHIRGDTVEFRVVDVTMKNN